MKTLLNIESEIEYSKNFNKKLVLKKKKAKKYPNKEFCEIASEADEVGPSKETIKLAVMNENDIKVNGKEEFPEEEPRTSNNNEETLKVSADNNNNTSNVQTETKFSTLPMMSKSKQKALTIPHRITPDGTKIYYLCDLPKKIRKGFKHFFSFDFKECE